VPHTFLYSLLAQASLRANLNSIAIGLVMLFFGLGVTAFWRYRDAATKRAEKLLDENEKLETRMRDMEKSLLLVNQQVLPMNAAFQAILIRELTHFHTPRMDELMQMMGPPCLLTDDDREELDDLLVERTLDMGDMISESERDAARMLPMVMRRVAREAEEIQTATPQLKLVVVAPSESVGEPDSERMLSPQTERVLLEKAELEKEEV